jgi:hypothetical protein
MEFDHIVRRIKAEFLEMPGLRLTLAQATRLWGIERALCESVVETLVGCAFLRRTSAGVILRNEA